MTENRPTETDGKGARKRGRPVQMCPQKRETLVLDCAMDLLSERGPDDVTMADIAQRAGMSKRTLYTLYRSREELLGAGLARISRSLFRPLRLDERDAPLAERLRILLTFNPKREPPGVVYEMLRIIIAEARSYPELSRSLSRSGPVLAASLVRDELARAVEAGEIALDPEEIASASELLVDMVVGNAIPGLLDPDRIPRNSEEQAARRDRAIDIFLHGVCPRHQ